MKHLIYLFCLALLVILVALAATNSDQIADRYFDHLEATPSIEQRITTRRQAEQLEETGSKAGGLLLVVALFSVIVIVTGTSLVGRGGLVALAGKANQLLKTWRVRPPPRPRQTPPPVTPVPQIGVRWVEEPPQELPVGPTAPLLQPENRPRMVQWVNSEGVDA